MINYNKLKLIINDLLIWKYYKMNFKINMILNSLNIISFFFFQEIAISFIKEFFIKLVINIIISENWEINFQ